MSNLTGVRPSEGASQLVRKVNKVKHLAFAQKYVGAAVSATQFEVWPVHNNGQINELIHNDRTLIALV